MIRILHTGVWHTIRSSVSLVLVVLLLAPSLSLGVAPHRAEAQLGGAAVSSATCLVSNLIGKFMVKIGKKAVAGAAAVAAVPVNPTGVNAAGTLSATEAAASNSWSALVKECVLDTFIWSLKDMIIKQMMRDTIGWINGGFNGTPGFVGDTGTWMKDLGTTFVNEVLFETGITDFVCTPFRADLTFNIFLEQVPDYSLNGKKTCSLKKWMTDAEFTSAVDTNQFGAVGLTGLMGIQQGTNDAVSSNFALRKEINDRLSENLIKPTNDMLSFGNGYISMKCDMDAEPGNERICTPGNFIQEQLNKVSAGPLDELIAADEFAEIINALIAAFVREVLNDDQGLIGRSGNAKYWNDAQSKKGTPTEWCAPSDPFCDPIDPGLPGSGTPLPPAEVAVLNAYSGGLSANLTNLIAIASVSPLAAVAAWLPILLDIESTLAGVDTSTSDAYATLNDIRTQIQNAAAGMGVGVALPAPVFPLTP